MMQQDALGKRKSGETTTGSEKGRSTGERKESEMDSQLSGQLAILSDSDSDNDRDQEESEDEE